MAEALAKQFGTGANASIGGGQLQPHYYVKKALTEAAKEQIFTPLADQETMPKHYGKKMVRYHYLPMLDDANINDQGIDAAGATLEQEKTIIITAPSVTNQNVYMDKYAVGSGADSAAATTAAQARALYILNKELKVTGADYATAKTNAIALGYKVDDTRVAVQSSGNLYGSSKDVGYISAKLPVVGEHGGRVNRVGFSRRTIEGTFNSFGMFDEWTQESYDFDSDVELEGHITMERTKAANEITEDMLQIDLLNAAGVVRFGGVATATGQITGEGGNVSKPTYRSLIKLATDLDNNRCPKTTKVLKGSLMNDTRTVRGGRIMFVGSEVKELFMEMTDLHGDPAFIDAKHYAGQTELLNGEIGSVHEFRIVVAQEMMNWSGAGATATAGNLGYRETNGKYDVFPMLVVGDGAFTTIGFNTDGKSTKFKIIIKKPGEATADRNNPYGKIGFASIHWYYGFMVLHPERIAVIKTVAPW